ncbi:hypothetical protein [Candidatus Spongiihabitans sp.]|uniref:hypothetical protein n=1 Tax=Candidatus Spongiihabitans sp. TaxID=3101308 RepID=UPI003C7DD196
MSAVRFCPWPPFAILASGPKDGLNAKKPGFKSNPSSRARGIRPPGMVEVPILQEQKSADRQGWWKCRFCRSKNLPTARDGGSVDTVWNEY